MKKAMILLAILFTTSANAMEGMSVVPNLSFNYMNFESSEVDVDFDPKFDFGIGADLVFDVNENIKWFTGISYQRFLANFSKSAGGNSIDIDVRGAYLDVPIGAQIYANEVIYFPVSLNALIDVGAKVEGEECAPGGCVTKSGDDGVKSFVLAANIGIGAKFNKFLVSLRYTMTLTDIAEDSDDEFRGFRLGLGYML